MSARPGPRPRHRPAPAAARGAALVLGLLVLLGAVAMTAGMARPAAEATRGVTVPPAALLAWGAAAAVAAGLMLSLLGPFWSRREKWVALLVFLGLLLGFAILAERSFVQTRQPVQQLQVRRATEEPPVTPGPSPSPHAVAPPPASQPRAPAPAGVPPWIVALAGGAALGLALLVLRLGGRRAGAAPRAAAACAVGDVVDASILEVSGETDPRQAIVAAWMAMAEALGRHGLRRRADEAAAEYMQRALGAVRVRAESVQRLTALFQRARYSDHPATPAMRDEALAALRGVRDDLREDEA